MAETTVHEPRSYIHDGNVYVIRDVWDDGGHVYRPGLKLVRCEYAVFEDDELAWEPCQEGVMFADIDPLVRPERG